MASGSPAKVPHGSVNFGSINFGSTEAVKPLVLIAIDASEQAEAALQCKSDHILRSCESCDTITAK